MTLQDEAVTYLLNFVCGLENVSTDMKGTVSQTSLRVGYTADPDRIEQYDIVFVPSGFFASDAYGKKESLPTSPLPKIEGIPFLFGSDLIEKKGSTIVIHADLPASAFCFLSRYEELCHPELRDEHGRFNARWSLLTKNGFLAKPLVDAYTAFIRKLLQETGRQMPTNQGKLSKLWLTHDVDVPFYCQGFRSFAREALKGSGLKKALRLALQKAEADPYYTFRYFFDTDSRAISLCTFPVEGIYFFKAGGNSIHDKPVYSLESKRMRHLLYAVQNEGFQIGLHGSYSSGKTGKISKEKKLLEKAIKENIYSFRQHFLRACEPSCFTQLENSGITDDFTMGYADMAGFRLGTCRPVRWINPSSGHLTSLLLHPLAIMDTTLFQTSYMGLSFDKAKDYCLQLVEQARLHDGELCLLWHNSNISVQACPGNQRPWIRDLYTFIIDHLCDIDPRN